MGCVFAWRSRLGGGATFAGRERVAYGSPLGCWAAANEHGDFRVAHCRRCVISMAPVKDPETILRSPR